MNATERAALLQGLEIHDEMTAVVDERTLEILERRRRTAVVRRRGWLVRRMLLVADLVGLVAAMLHWPSGLSIATTALAFSTCARRLSSFSPRFRAGSSLRSFTASTTTTRSGQTIPQRTTSRAYSTWSPSALGCSGLARTSPVSRIRPPPKLLIFWAAAIAFITAGRAMARSLARRNAMYLQNAVIVGAGDVGQLVGKKLSQHPEYGINLVGFVDDKPKERRDDLEHLTLLGGRSRLAAIVRLFDVERVIVAFSNDSHEETLALLRSLKGLDVQIDIVPRLFETVGPNYGLHMIEGIPLVGLPPLRLSWSSRLLKRALDIFGSSLGLILTSPLVVLASIAVKLDSRGPVLYRHARVGLAGQPIEVIKFRTMKLDACRGERYGGASAESAFDALVSDLTAPPSSLRRTSLLTIPA